MIYIQDQDKQNIHPNIIVNNKKVQFSDKLKRYDDTLQFSSENSQQNTSNKNNKLIQQKNNRRHLIKDKKQEPLTTPFAINQLQQISKQISLKDVSRISSRSQYSTKLYKKNWVKALLQPSQAESKLLQKIQDMLEKQTFKPVYSTISRHKKAHCYNTMESQTLLSSEKQSNQQQSVQNYKSRSPDSNNRTLTLSNLINLSKLTDLSSKTLGKYLLGLQKQKGTNQLQKSQKISQFNFLDTQRSKELMGEKKNAQIQAMLCKKSEIQELQNWVRQVQQIYSMIIATEKTSQVPISTNVGQMLDRIRKFVDEALIQEQRQKNMKIIRQEESTCLLQD